MSRSKLNYDSTKSISQWPLMIEAILLMMGVMYSRSAQAQWLPMAPVVVDACPSCASLTDLQNYAIEALGAEVPGYQNNAAVYIANGTTYYVEPQTALGETNPAGGTEIFVASVAKPIAAEMRYTETILYVLGKPVLVYHAVPVTPDDMGTAALDALTHARASEVPPIIVPATIAPSANNYQEVDILTGFVNGVLVYGGEFGTSIWRELQGFSATEWIEVTDTQTGEKYTIWKGDEFTLKFADGSTIKVKFTAFLGPGGITFEVELGSARDPHGQPYGLSGLLPGGNSTNYGCGPGGILCSDQPSGVPALCFYKVQVCWAGDCTVGWDPCGS
jgi:hypothetical protein